MIKVWINSKPFSCDPMEYDYLVHHVAFRVENIEEALEELKEKGIRLIDEKPRRGAGGAKIAFLHPKATKGVLVELCERE